MKKNSSDKIYSIWSGSILLCMVLAVSTLIFASCAKGNGKAPKPSQKPETPIESPIAAPETTLAPPPTDIPGISTQEPVVSAETRLGETPDMGQEYIDKMVFLGDSTTNGLAHYKVVPENQVWTPANGTLTLSRWSIDAIQYREEGTEISIIDAVTKKQPEYMLITLGVNGVSFMKEDSFKKVYAELVEAIKIASPNTKIILNSIYPVTADYKVQGITNERISAANTWVEAVAKATGVKYLDSASSIKDETGAMPKGYDNGDFIHPNAETYGIIINYIRTHGYK
ncbi:MAG: GDSL-type esterase/lipase family protein [Oscillospiraceae bacterium]